MARKVTVELVDDFDGESTAEDTVRFGIDGVDYEIDLSAKNADKLRAALAPWIDAARRVGRAPRGKEGKGRSVRDREQTAAIREWARQNGVQVSSRGRIAADVVAAYEKAAA
ncbi:histone-like nucleoid-structuring protein Lsr2 [Nocardia brasiliensis]|uniref:histone-like nucleoid-structuring protein Lsr2 n=1 Tax=Nocardia brasiliensis TaxID=37326 RepID=UPI00189371AB|nr:Lsr2 family protein [Nocardia brasiliensis]MBF6543394.1 Lsr2 family protein [Nocardia brasiliensis]